MIFFFKFLIIELFIIFQKIIKNKKKLDIISIDQKIIKFVKNKKNKIPKIKISYF